MSALSRYCPLHLFPSFLLTRKLCHLRYLTTFLPRTLPPSQPSTSQPSIHFKLLSLQPLPLPLSSLYNLSCHHHFYSTAFYPLRPSYSLRHNTNDDLLFSYIITLISSLQDYYRSITLDSVPIQSRRPAGAGQISQR